MSAVLPHGLITIARTEVASPSSTDFVETCYERSQIIHRFWKVHNVRHRVTHQNSDLRSQNLFWRVWSDPWLRLTVSPTTLTTLWNRCRDDNAPTPFDLTVRSTSSRSSSSTQFESNSKAARLVEHPVTVTLTQPQYSGSISGSPPAKDTKLSLVNEKELGKIVTPSHNPSSSSSFEESSQPSTRTLPNSGRPKLLRNSSSRIANSRSVSGSTKPKRPSLGRRKTSQSTAQKHGKSSKSPIIGEHNNLRGPSGVGSSFPGATLAAFQLPSPSSWEDESSNEGVQSSSLDQKPLEAAELTIDKDFRGRFAEKIASSTNLAGIGRMKKTASIVRFAEDNRTSSEKDQEGEEPQAQMKTGGRPTLPHRQSANSVAISEGDDAEEDVPRFTPLPRTTSQLSFLISERRATQGSHSLRPEKALKDLQIRSKRKTEDAEGEQILAMARSQGVTKAGGIQVPRQQRLGHEVDSRYSSPEQDLTF